MTERSEDSGASERFPINSLRQQWTSLIAELSPSADPVRVASTFDNLVQRYSEPTRAYHTLEHISEMLALINSNADNLSYPNNLRVATWFHDVLYDSRANDNEEQSEQFARATLAELGVNAEVIEQTSSYILATKQHDLPSGVDSNSDLAFFLDADMSILAADRTRYEKYAHGVAFEYRWAQNVNGTDLYTPGRLQFLQSAIDKPIFHTDRMKPQEPKAKANMEWEMGQLQAKLEK